jgi:hypothetical protein
VERSLAGLGSIVCLKIDHVRLCSGACGRRATDALSVIGELCRDHGAQSVHGRL